MKRILTALLALALIFALTLPVFATSERALVWDETGKRDAATVHSLNESAKKLQSKYNIFIAIVYVDGNAADYKPEEIMGDVKDYVLFIVGDTNNRFYTKGVADEVFADPDDRDRMGYVYDEVDLWQNAALRYFEVMEEYLSKFYKTQPEEETPEVSSTAPITSEEKAEEKSFSPLYLLPVLAAVIIAGVAVAFARKKKA